MLSGVPASASLLRSSCPSAASATFLFPSCLPIPGLFSVPLRNAPLQSLPRAGSQAGICPPLINAGNDLEPSRKIKFSHRKKTLARQKKILILMINAAIGHAVIEQNLCLDKMRGGVLLIIDFFLRGLFLHSLFLLQAAATVLTTTVLRKSSQAQLRFLLKRRAQLLAMWFLFQFHSAAGQQILRLSMSM